MKGLVWFVAGIAVGAGAMALATTERGAEVRRRIKERLVSHGLMTDDSTNEFVEMFVRELDED